LPIVVVADDAPTTSYAGLLPYLELWRQLGMPRLIEETVAICGGQGWTDRQMVLALVLVNLAGGGCMTDIDHLEADAGLCELIRTQEEIGLKRKERRALVARFRGGRSRTVPAATQIAAFLEACHDAAEEAKRAAHTAFIPAANAHLQSLWALNTGLLARWQAWAPQTVATLDGDATVVETTKHAALFCYQHVRAYQPYTVWWAEQEAVLHSQFRDGNVPAGWGVIEVMQQSLAMLPPGVQQVFTRQDTAAYQAEFLVWCEREREHPGYGRIQFSVSVDVTAEFRKAALAATEWTPEYRTVKGRREATGREWAEVVYVPNSHAVLSDIEPFRYLAVREKLGDQLALLDGEALPFQTITVNKVPYKLHGIVTNRREMPADELIAWHYQRCGKSEEAHAVMKEDFAGGVLPSAKFGANAAWWALVVLSMNLERIMRGLLGAGWRSKRMKAIRYALLVRPGRLVSHARQLCLRVPKVVAAWLATLREAIVTLTWQLT
jgi:hypothetical protein